MVSLNIGNVPTGLYNQLLELKGKLHARTWVEVLNYAVQEPQGTIDFEIFKAGLFECPSCKRPALNQAPSNLSLLFRSGDFVYQYEGNKPKDQQYTALPSLPQKTEMKALQVHPHIAKNYR